MGQPSGCDPIVSPLPLRGGRQEEPRLCGPQLQGVLLLPSQHLTHSLVKFMEAASRSLALNGFQTRQEIVTKHFFTLHMCLI